MKPPGKKNQTQSKDFQTFMHDYFTGHSMIRTRGEEDTTVWNRLKEEELKIAKQKILDELPSDYEYLMRAVAQFRDERAIPKLEWTAENGANEHSRCYAAKVLFDWVGYHAYFDRLDEVFKSGSQWSKINLDYWIKGLKEEDALKYFWTAMNDPDSFVRYRSYRALENYYGVRQFRKDGSEIKYFTDNSVFQDKILFEKRKAELKRKIERWKNNYDQ